MIYKKLVEFSEKQVHEAGPRYIPNMDSNAPNIGIDNIKNSFAILALNEDFFNRIKNFTVNIEEVFNYISGIDSHALKLVRSLLGRLHKFVTYTPQQCKNAAPPLQSLVNKIERTLEEQYLRPELYNPHLAPLIAERERRDSGELPLDEDLRRRYIAFKKPISELANYLNSNNFDLVTKNIAILFGQRGSGKTHFLCDLTKMRINKKLPTLFCLARDIPSNKHPLTELVNAVHKTSRSSVKSSIFKQLNSLAKITNERAFIIIDGINEGDFDSWCKYAKNIVSKVSHYPNIALIISCRSEYQDEFLNALGDLNDHLTVGLEHPGFKYDFLYAQKEYFKFYEIDLPAVPLLNEEFANPLALGIICRSLQSLPKRKQKKECGEVVACQKTFVDLFEQYIKNASQHFSKVYGWSGKDLWDKLFKQLSFCMINLERSYLTRIECLDAIAKWGFSDENLCLDILIKEGLLIKYRVWGESVYRIEFPFQGLSDHLIARELLKLHLDKTSLNKIKKSFSISSPLSRIVERKNANLQYFNHPNLVAAIFLELPERLKRVPNLENKELLAYLSTKFYYKGSIDLQAAKIFLKTLLWRDESTFSLATIKYIDLCLKFSILWPDVFETLVCLAARTSEKTAPRNLRKLLKNCSLTDRDLSWSEYLRTCESESAVYRILAWIKDPLVLDRINKDYAQKLIILVGTFLTTTHQKLRDTATEALFLLGLKHPTILFSETLEFLDFNDPYVIERMLAASYGVLVSLQADRKLILSIDNLGFFAKELNKDLLSPTVKHVTIHALCRDYAYNIVNIVKNLRPNYPLKRWPKYVCFDSVPAYLNKRKIRKKLYQDIYEKITFGKRDFSNYVLGNLIKSRHNYDYQNPEFCEMLDLSTRRIIDLGYVPQKFSEQEQHFCRSYPYGGDDRSKIEDYFKKYLWITYYEICGSRAAEKKIDNFDLLSVRDIDSTFPLKRRWSPELSNPFNTLLGNDIKWQQEGPSLDHHHLYKLDTIESFKGPWILLAAFIDQKDEPLQRMLVLTVHLLLVKNDKLPFFIDTFSKLENLDYHHHVQIPSGYFAGEIPLSSGYTSNFKITNQKHSLLPNYLRWEKGLRIETPLCRWQRVKDTSFEDQLISYFPSPAICSALGLINHPQTFDLYDNNGNLATIFRSSSSDRNFRESLFLYIREDLLNTYLSLTKQRMIWIAQGERLITGTRYSVNRPKTEDIAPDDWKKSMYKSYILPQERNSPLRTKSKKHS